MLENVKVGSINYDVQKVENMNEDFSLLGQIHYHKGIIQLDETMSEDRKNQVLTHEVLHGVFYEAGFDEQEEDMIRRVGAVLHQVLKENDFYSAFNSEADAYAREMQKKAEKKQ
ncbi:ImmA/IrrE family metallo-endopeptidase [Domibacillus indicus]|uniref:ImmA/IrrE family metallo-endopeptidase n=1 Tax=Domibacillus indicus TaxID=1437523 RepID=UPI002041169A|nr:ImmA/IrrE family metallo-endopeptidase [Domibacillus indicus]MCM3789440.1 ImmA/IrrE family metallo-endopeptidase [Domibacillus indicus]